MLYFQRRCVVLCASYQRSVAMVLLFNLLLPSCHSELDALKGHHPFTEVSRKSGIQKQASGQALAIPSSPLSSTSQQSTSFSTTISSMPAAVGMPQHTAASQTASSSPQVSSRVFVTSSGEYVRFTHDNGQWQAALRFSSSAYAPHRTFPVVSSTAIGPQLAWLQRQDIRTSKARIHIIPTSFPPYSSCVYLGKYGLLGGMFGGDSLRLPERVRSARQASRGAIEEEVKMVPLLTSLCFKSLLTACKDEDEDFRSDAEWSLVEAAKVEPEQALSHLLTACKDGHLSVREAARRALVEAAKEAPVQTLGHLLTACKDASVHQVAIRAIKNAAKVAPKQVLAPLRAACHKKNKFVRQAAIMALKNVAWEAPELASACLETLLTAGKDASELVRDSAMKVLMDVAKAAPEQALTPLLAVVKDEDWYIRYVVIMALSEVAQASPKHASACLGPLREACRDEDTGVRAAANCALEKTKAAIKMLQQRPPMT